MYLITIIDLFKRMQVDLSFGVLGIDSSENFFIISSRSTYPKTSFRLRNLFSFEIQTRNDIWLTLLKFAVSVNFLCNVLTLKI